MSQAKIIEFLIHQRKQNNNHYWSVKELSKHLDENLVILYPQITKLYRYGFLEMWKPKGKTRLHFRRRVRIKETYCNGEKK